jgi:hypothetical protein
MQTRFPVLRWLEIRCGQLNDGLAVFAVVLGIVIVITACEQRLPEIASLFQPIDPETGISVLSH